MKKIFSFVAAALLSVAMTAGENDLLWDYTDAAPSNTGEDHGLYWNTSAGVVNDAAGTNNGLKGLKMNGSGWCYFTKAAVAGKLKLTFGPRKNADKVSMEIFTWAGETPAAETSIATTAEQSESATQIIDLTAEVTNIYIKRKASKEAVMQKIEFVESVPRSFVDFEMKMASMTEEYDFSTLPAGVTASGTFNTDQHGYRNFTITVPVDGSVKFTIGDCQFGNQPIVVKNSAGETIASLAYPKAGCYGASTPEKVFSYIYTGGEDVLTFTMQYCNYFKAEATDIRPCEITYKDQNGTTLGKVETYEGATVGEIPYKVADLPAIAENEAFRGWFYTNEKKVKATDMLTGNTTIQAKVTPKESVTVGSIQTYALNKETFYPEDHETITISGKAYYHDGTHGWAFKNGDDIAIEVAGNAQVILTLCKEGKADATWAVTDGKGAEVATVSAKSSSDGETAAIQYKGEATTLHFTLTSAGENYLHKMVVYNVLDFLEKDEKTGYFIVPANDGASLLMAIAIAEAGDKIFLPKGLYDLGETVLTPISKNNISLIGESMDETIIRNAPAYYTEGIGSTATLLINKNVSGIYMQDLTIQNALDYFTALEKTGNGRAVALWDQGTQTVCKNVKLLSNQDTYYSNLAGAVKYFEDCEIRGTVDFICGDGSVYFKNNLLFAEQRNRTGGGEDALTANNGPSTDKGFVFEGCTIKSVCPTVSLGRAWNKTPQCTYLNTTVDFSAGEFSFNSSKIQRWTKELMSTETGWPVFGEYNTRATDGTPLTPESNVVTFQQKSPLTGTMDLETVLSAEQAAAFTMSYTLGAWASTAEADAKQAECEKEAKDFEPNGIYLVEADGEFAALILGSEFMDRFAVYDGVNYTVRKANARGGFGKVAGDPGQGVENTAAEAQKVQKIFRDGQVVIVRDGKAYNMLGAQL